jgi:hypothetical protein
MGCAVALYIFFRVPISSPGSIASQITGLELVEQKRIDPYAG